MKGTNKSMLLEFSCENHRSIKDRVVFSALAGTDKEHNEMLYKFNSYKVLSTAAIYGANGSGKSNLLHAIDFVQGLVVNSIHHQPGQVIRQQVHKMAGSDSVSRYSILFVANKVRYAFGFSLQYGTVIDEYLYYFPKGRQTKIFERSADGFTEGGKFKKKLETCNDVIAPNRLLLSCAANFSQVAEIKEAYAFFRDDIVIYRTENAQRWMQYSLAKINEDEVVKKLLIAFLQAMDVDARDIRVKMEQQPTDTKTWPESVQAFLSDEAKAFIAQQQTTIVEASVVYEKFSVELFQEESTGVRRLISFLVPFFDILAKGKVLFVDELETHLHEAVLCKFIELLGDISVPKSVQVFFTTHDTSILDLKRFRRDQIWFTEMDKSDRSTNLYSLVEIQHVRKDENIEKGYMLGRYGGIPMLNEKLADIINQ